MSRPTTENTEQIDQMVSDPPELHIWNGVPRVGGMGGDVGRRLVRNIRARPEAGSFDVLETGAGLSTLLFLAFGVTSLTSVDPTPGLRGRVVEEAARRGLDAKPLEYVEERSELALPRLAASGREYDLCLIDGAHTWPTVFVDFCYANLCLRAGGLLLLDDVQLHSVRQLYLLLAAQPGYRMVSEQWDWKLAAFVKETREPFLSQSQPFLVASSGGYS